MLNKERIFSMLEKTEWKGFNGRLWKEEIWRS